MNASVAIQTLPEAANDEELIRIVDEVIDYIKSTGLNYYVGPFETAIEGDYDELMDIVKECQHIAVCGHLQPWPPFWSSGRLSPWQAWSRDICCPRRYRW